MPIHELARERVATAPPDKPAAELAALMRDHEVGSVVITEGGEPVGIVTDRDLVVDVFAEGVIPDSLSAGDVMTGDLVTVEADAGTFEVCEAMCENKVRRMPVVEDGSLVGIVTLDDMIRLLADEFGRLANIVHAESPPY